MPPVDTPVTPSKPKQSINQFKDIKETDYYYDAIKWAVENGITSGTSATTFSPNDTCTRAQILTFLWKANGSPYVDGDNPYMDDVYGFHYYYAAAKWSFYNNVLLDGMFCGDTPCTRASAVEFLYNAAGSPNINPTTKFSDINPNEDYAKAVAWALENGITGGTSETTFSPDTTCTRGQIASFLYRVYGNK